jgi:hypothetical protein
VKRDQKSATRISVATISVKFQKTALLIEFFNHENHPEERKSNLENGKD